ncbi:hypothetical protein Droror1_Dr00015879 [Drosera rotundifolia]
MHPAQGQSGTGSHRAATITETLVDSTWFLAAFVSLFLRSPVFEKDQRRRRRVPLVVLAGGKEVCDEWRHCLTLRLRSRVGEEGALHGPAHLREKMRKVLGLKWSGPNGLKCVGTLVN